MSVAAGQWRSDVQKRSRAFDEMNLMSSRRAIYLCHGGISLCRVAAVVADPDSGWAGVTRGDFGVRSRVSTFETNRAYNFRRQSGPSRAWPAQQFGPDDLRHPDHCRVDSVVSDAESVSLGLRRLHRLATYGCQRSAGASYNSIFPDARLTR